MFRNLKYALKPGVGLAGLALIVSSASDAAAVHEKNPGNDKKNARVQAQRATRAPLLDGDVLGDPVWQAVPGVGEFFQTTPDEGSPATEKTVVRVIFTSDTLFVAAVCYDSEPEQIIASDSRRDASLSETDCFQLILDTYLDKQNGFVFGTNPAGIEYDAQVTNEGEGSGFGSRQRGGSGGGFNINWDGSWTVKTLVFEEGWSAEFAIPFRTLRFGSKRKQDWGINFQRNIRRRNERAFWAPLPRQYNLYRLSMAGKLSGLEIGPPRNLKVMPYALSSVTREFDVPVVDRSTDYTREFGVDAKYGITPSLTLDMTYNTDFAQVEVDEQQINLDRFNLFFPEKRPFFLENAGLFSVGSSGEAELFFSRRIGIASEDGLAVPIRAGGRMSGKVGNVSIGLLNMQTEAARDSVRANNFTVARIFRELPNRSSIGVMFTNRQGTGDATQLVESTRFDYNRAVAVDGRLGLGENGQLAGFAAKTFTPGFSGSDYAFKGDIDYNAEAWQLSFSYTEVADNFNPEMGFLSRTDARGASEFRKFTGLIFNRTRPTDMIGLHEVRPHVSYRGFWDFSGFQETGFIHMDTHWEFKNGYEIHTGVNVTQEGVRTGFDLLGIPVPAGRYEHAELQLVGNTNEGAPISLSSRWTIGGFFGGTRVSSSSTYRMRFGDALTTDFNYRRNDLTLAQGHAISNQIRFRLSYSFTPRIYLQSLLQYNDSSDRWSTNIRFAWLQAASSGLYIVYNETQDVLDGRFDIQNRSLIVKFSRVFEILQ